MVSHTLSFPKHTGFRVAEQPSSFSQLELSSIIFRAKSPKSGRPMLGPHSKRGKDWWIPKETFKINNGALSLMTNETKLTILECCKIKQAITFLCVDKGLHFSTE